MNLDEQLRATLSQEAEGRHAPPPDVHSLITGGRVRRRRRTAARIGTAAAVAVLLGGGAYGVTQLDSQPSGAPEITREPTQPPRTPLSDDRPPLEPGTHRMYVGRDANVEVIVADVTVDGPGWRDSSGDPMVSEGRSRGGVGFYQPDALAGRSGCTSSWDARQTRKAGETPPDLAQQLTRLPRSTVVQPPTPTQAFGRPAIHLKARIDDNCPPEIYRVAEGRGISYSYVAKEVVIDFWVLDLGGDPVVVDMWHQAGSPTQLVERVARARDSISFVLAD